jgi:hypothetical protein
LSIVILFVLSCPVVIVLALMPLPVIPVVQVLPPSLVKKIPPLVIRTFSAAFSRLEVVIPVSSQTTDWFLAFFNILVLLENAVSRAFEAIVPSVSIILAAFAYAPELSSIFCTAAVYL